MTEEPAKLRRFIAKEEWIKIQRIIVSTYKKYSYEKQELLRCVALYVAKLLLEVDPLMDFLCERTCSKCEDICCDAKDVFYNEVDLFFFVSLGVAFPPFQTRKHISQEKCHYWIKDFGCVLNRLFRPYVCTWFICDTQMEILNELFNGCQIRRFQAIFREIRRARLFIASMFDGSIR